MVPDVVPDVVPDAAGAEAPGAVDYAEQLAHDVKHVVVAVGGALGDMKRCHGMLKQLAALEADSSHKQIRLLAAATAATSGEASPGGDGRPGDSPVTVAGVWEQTRRAMATAASLRSRTSRELVTEVVEPLGDFNKRCKEQLGRITVRLHTARRDADTAHDAAAKGLQSCESLLQATREVAAAETASLAEGAPSAGTGGWLSSLTSRLVEYRAPPSVGRQAKRAHAAAVTYRDAVDEANRLQRHYHTVVPTALQELQALVMTYFVFLLRLL